ncbi:hypothetical protein CDL15_Pgr017087 [Punica granatum]|uniref:Uncharacterized protein n=1 Tax=Punica granatum TaxID=22663 RepID=A0A218WY10_PUNGR|nr:hypothetical protein CDL15_Pgr017087 [Punica granatum]
MGLSLMVLHSTAPQIYRSQPILMLIGLVARAPDVPPLVTRFLLGIILFPSVPRSSPVGPKAQLRPNIVRLPMPLQRQSGFNNSFKTLIFIH